MPRGAKPGERRGGREKGIPNKETLTLRELMERETKGVPLPVLLLRTGLVAIDSGMISEGAKIVNDAAKYAYPTLKQVELSGEVKAAHYVAAIPLGNDGPSTDAAIKEWAAKVASHSDS